MSMNKRRSSYSINNAIRFKSFFDDALKTKKDIFIPSERVGLSPATLQQQISDALLFLCQEYDIIIQDDLMPMEEIKKFSQIEYHALKGMINFKINWHSPLGVTIKFKKLWNESFNDRKKKESEEVKIDTLGWKDRVIEYTEKGDGLLNIEKLHLTEEDIQWVHNVLGGINCEYTVTPHKILAMKE